MKKLRWVWPTLGVFAAILAVFAARLDPDFGWHVRSGQHILQHGIPYRDIFTFTAADFPWINHEWLSDIVIAAVVGVAGTGGVAVMFAAVWTAALVLAVRRPDWTVLAVATAAVLGIITARPNAWSALGLALVLVAIRRRVYWPLVPMFWVWANLHGGFVLGFVFLLAAGVRDRKYLGVLAACVLVSLINPYGPALYVEIWRTMTDANLRNVILEWKPLAIDGFVGLYVVAFLGVAASLKWRPAVWLPTLMLASAVSSLRQFPLFVVASLGLVDGGYRRLMEAAGGRWARWLWLAPVAATGVLVAAVWVVWDSPDNRRPDAQIAQLRAEPCRGNLYNDYDFGGYLIWQLPEAKVYIDGRMPSWKHEGRNYLAQWQLDLTDAGARRQDFARHNIDCVLIQPKHHELVSELKDEGWQVTSADAGAVLLRRAVSSQ